MDDERKPTIMSIMKLKYNGIIKTYDLENDTQNQLYWIRLAKKHLIGHTIKDVIYCDSKWLKDLGWENQRTLRILLDNGHSILPSIDPEGNAPGCLFTTFKGAASCLQ